MSSHRWTEGLSRQQLEVIRKDTQEREERFGTNQSHVYKDIELELKRREANRQGRC